MKQRACCVVIEPFRRIERCLVCHNTLALLRASLAQRDDPTGTYFVVFDAFARQNTSLVQDDTAHDTEYGFDSTMMRCC